MYTGLSVEMDRASIYLPVTLIEKLDRYAQQRLTSRSSCTRDLLTEILNAKEATNAHAR